MHCTRQCIFVTLILLLGFLYLVLYVALISTTFAKECISTSSLEYCAQLYFSKVQEMCSASANISTSVVCLNVTKATLRFEKMSLSNTSSIEQVSDTISELTSTQSKQNASLASSTLTSGHFYESEVTHAFMGNKSNRPSSSPFTDAKTEWKPQELIDSAERIRWNTCPEPGKGRDSVIISARIDGRLGNVVWSYLSVLMTAKIYKLRPVLHNESIQFITQKVFDIEQIRMPTVEWLDAKCNLKGWLADSVRNRSRILGERRVLYNGLENPPKVGLEVYNYDYYTVASEYLVQNWDDLKKELILKKNLGLEAQKHLYNLTRVHLDKMTKIGHTSTDIAFVGVHIRRDDYVEHVKEIFQFAKIASPKFFHSAMDWLTEELKQPLVFVAITDDEDWTNANIIANRSDVYLAGNSDTQNPGIDLAILAACNHTIFAYGTFGLTAAMLTSRPGGFTVIFDPENGTVTKEMEFGSNLPFWRIMTEDGEMNYQYKPLNYTF